jgi:hypothetical protein
LSALALSANNLSHGVPLVALLWIGALLDDGRVRTPLTAAVQVGGLSVAQAKSLAQAGLRALVISGNLGQPDSRFRFDLPPDQIQRYVSDFIAAVSSA